MNRSFTAKRFPKQPGPAAWNAILPPQPPADELSSWLNADVAVIGAGFAGLSAARRLIQLDPTLRVIVLEAGRVADGPAGRNSGFMIDLPHDLAADDYAGKMFEEDRKQTRLNRLAIRFASNVAAETKLSTETFDPSGKINGAATDAGDRHNRSYARHLDAMGESCELLDEGDMRALTGIPYYISGLYTPGTVLIQPAAYIRGLAASLGPETIFENSPVRSIERSGKNWLLETPRGRVEAPKVILAVNGHAESFGFFPRRLMHVFTYASMTSALDADARRLLGGKPRWGVTPADPMGATVRRISGSAGDRIVLRVRFSYDPSMEISETRLKSVARVHDRSFARRFPMLKAVAMEYRWAGHLCLAWNGAPAFGIVEENVFAACCQNGLGTTKGTLAGMGAAELALDAPQEAANGLLAQASPSRLPPEPFAWIGANATMRYREWRAGAEA